MLQIRDAQQLTHIYSIFMEELLELFTKIINVDKVRAYTYCTLFFR